MTSMDVPPSSFPNGVTKILTNYNYDAHARRQPIKRQETGSHPTAAAQVLKDPSAVWSTCGQENSATENFYARRKPTRHSSFRTKKKVDDDEDGNNKDVKLTRHNSLNRTHQTNISDPTSSRGVNNGATEANSKNPTLSLYRNRSKSRSRCQESDNTLAVDPTSDNQGPGIDFGKEVRPTVRPDYKDNKEKDGIHHNHNTKQRHRPIRRSFRITSAPRISTRWTKESSQQAPHAPRAPPQSESGYNNNTHDQNLGENRVISEQEHKSHDPDEDSSTRIYRIKLQNLNSQQDFAFKASSEDGVLKRSPSHADPATRTNASIKGYNKNLNAFNSPYKINQQPNAESSRIQSVSKSVHNDGGGNYEHYKQWNLTEAFEKQDSLKDIYNNQSIDARRGRQTGPQTHHGGDKLRSRSFHGFEQQCNSTDGSRPNTAYRQEFNGVNIARPDAERLDSGRTGAERPDADRPGADRPGAERPGAERQGAERQDADRQYVDRPGANRSVHDRHDTIMPVPRKPQPPMKKPSTAPVGTSKPGTKTGSSQANVSKQTKREGQRNDVRAVAPKGNNSKHEEKHYEKELARRNIIQNLNNKTGPSNDDVIVPATSDPSQVTQPSSSPPVPVPSSSSRTSSNASLGSRNSKKDKTKASPQSRENNNHNSELDSILRNLHAERLTAKKETAKNGHGKGARAGHNTGERHANANKREHGQESETAQDIGHPHEQAQHTAESHTTSTNYSVIVEEVMCRALRYLRGRYPGSTAFGPVIAPYDNSDGDVVMQVAPGIFRVRVMMENPFPPGTFQLLSGVRYGLPTGQGVLSVNPVGLTIVEKRQVMKMYKNFFEGDFLSPSKAATWIHKGLQEGLEYIQGNLIHEHYIQVKSRLQEGRISLTIRAIHREQVNGAAEDWDSNAAGAVELSARVFPAILTSGWPTCASLQHPLPRQRPHALHGQRMLREVQERIEEGAKLICLDGTAVPGGGAGGGGSGGLSQQQQGRSTHSMVQKATSAALVGIHAWTVSFRPVEEILIDKLFIYEPMNNAKLTYDVLGMLQRGNPLWGILTPALRRTLMLWTVKRAGVEGKGPGEWLRAFVACAYKAFTSGYCPQFFQPNVNMVVGVDKECFKYIMRDFEIILNYSEHQPEILKQLFE